MIIGIDASRAEKNYRTGTENYSYKLILNLAKIDKINHYILFSKNPLKDELAPEALGTNFSNTVISWPLFWTQIGLSYYMIAEKPDVMFVPSHVLPLMHPTNCVVTIHGLEYEYYPENYSFFEKLYLRLGTIFSAKNARKIIVPSLNTKKDLIKFYGVPEGKISVIYHGADIEPEGDGEKKGSGNDPYILFIGRLEARKNIIRLVDAFNMIKKRDSVLGLRLVLAGSEGRGSRDIKKSIANSPFKSDIIIKGYLSEKDKKEVLQDATVFVCPSIYEGFGLSILEAQAAGIPVVASSSSSIPEVAGKGALFVNPKKADDIADKLSAVLTDHGKREELIQSGLENVRRFSWPKCAKETLKILTS